ncbi:hypothetical protein BV511_03065 [Methylorubrum extorquens]|nr:hypothetical protein BV511_03065 [Methylorubrum extorquens]
MEPPVRCSSSAPPPKSAYARKGPPPLYSALHQRWRAAFAYGFILEMRDLAHEHSAYNGLTGRRRGEA